MSSVDLAVASLRTDEGYRQMAYKDTVGQLTIGYGFCISAGISKPAALALLSAQTAELEQQLSTYYWWASLDDARAAVILNAAFNLGVSGLLHFPKMLSAIAAKDWQTASTEILNSDAAREAPDRYRRLAQGLLLEAPNVAQA